MKIMISACLTGENCKYNGGNNWNEGLKEIDEAAFARSRITSIFIPASVERMELFRLKTARQECN